MQQIKTIFFPLEKTKKNEKPPPRKRIITETQKWHSYLDDHLDVDQQWSMLIALSQEYNIPVTIDISYTSLEVTSEKIVFLKNEIQRKIHGYRSQDVKKNKFDPKYFISLEYVLKKILETELNCFYCQGPVKIWYEIARDPLQWTLERINNKIGHNVGNIEISRLQCNLNRRCMHHERYLKTKEMKVVLKVDKKESEYKEDKDI
jgi:hypothetical protein